MLFKKVYKEIIITHTTETHSEPNQTSKLETFAKMINHFWKKLRLRGCLFWDFKPDIKFQLVKRCIRYIFLLVCFSSLNESLCQTKKMLFILLQKLFLFMRKSNFLILNFQISWRHLMSNHKTRNTFNWITWEVNTAC